MKTPKTNARPSKGLAKQIISTAIILATALLLLYYLTTHISDFKQLFSLSIGSLWLIVILVLILLFNFLITGMLNNELMKPFGVSLKPKEYFGLSIVTNFYNYITPFRGGMIARAAYLKKKHNFAIVNFLATLSAVYVLVFLIASLLGLISMLFIKISYNLFNLPVFILFLGIFLFMFLIIILSPKIPESKNKWLNRFIKVINGWHLIKNNKRVIFIVSIITLIQLALGAISSILTYRIIGLDLSFSKALFLSAIGNLSILVSITPGNLGVGDAIAVFSASLIGITLTQAVAATILGRAIGLITIFILGPIFSYILLKHKPEPKSKPKDI